MMTHRLDRISIALLIGLAFLRPGGAAQAQEGWPPATILWQAEPGTGPYGNISPCLTTDPTGAVHLAWLNFPTEVGNSGEQVLMYYSRWDGRGWTTPVDIFVGTNAQPLGGPVLLPTEDGRLHVLWVSSSRLMHSLAWADDAARPQAWAAPAPTAAFSRPVFSSFDAASDARGRFHAVIAERPGDVFYIGSDDQGATWSSPSAISRVGADLTAYQPKVAVAPDGRIHVVWVEVSPTDNTTRSMRVKYAHSADDGSSWSQEREFSTSVHGDPNVAVFGDRIYVTWNASTATSGGRYLAYSDDGGVTWSSSIRFSNRAGLSSHASMAQDSLGRLHLLTGEGEYAMWDGANITPALALSPVEIQTERCRLAVANGNALIAVFPPDDGIVYATVRRLDVPAIPGRTPPARAEEAPRPTATLAAPVAQSEPATAAGVKAGAFNTAAPAAASSSAFPIVLSTASALAVVLAAIAWNRSGRRR